MAAEELIKKLKGLKAELQTEYKVKKIGIFGSFVKGEQKKTSDIDVLVEFEEDADLFSLIGLSDFLKTKLKREVDVVPERALRKELRASILRDVVYV
ncbi:nucleotidyltransferase family protein [Candidatus Micrarchaeota archaeon]|nr:nucleotidyltransferase family protein [Candidatus Micrarchaeota archaeon]